MRNRRRIAADGCHHWHQCGRPAVLLLFVLCSDDCPAHSVARAWSQGERGRKEAEWSEQNMNRNTPPLWCRLQKTGEKPGSAAYHSISHSAIGMISSLLSLSLFLSLSLSLVSTSAAEIRRQVVWSQTSLCILLCRSSQFIQLTTTSDDWIGC